MQVPQTKLSAPHVMRGHIQTMKVLTDKYRNKYILSKYSSMLSITRKHSGCNLHIF